MKPLETWLAQYGESHRNPVNRQIHKLCVPAIFFSLVGLLSLLRMASLFDTPLASVASLACLASLVFYWSLGWAPFLKMFFLEFFTLAALAIAESSIIGAAYWYAGIFIVAWIGQFIGHKIEGKKPSFFEDLQFLLIGPLWVFRLA